MKLSKYIRESKQAHIEFLLNEIQENCGPWLKNPQADGFLYRGTRNPIMSMKVVKSRLELRVPKDTPVSIHYELNRLFTKKFGWPVRNGVFVTSQLNTAKHYHGEGDPYIFMPIGKFEFVWSPEVDDLFADYIENNLMNTEEDMEYEYNEGNYTLHIYELDGKRIEGWELNYNISLNNLKNIDLYKPGTYEFEDKVDFRTIHKLKIHKMSYEEFVEHYFEGNHTPEEVVDLYTDRGLRDAIRSGKEICFKCDEYYLIERKFEEDIVEAFYQ